MSDFDWLTFFAEHAIPYQTHGANVAGNNVAICCPYCGDDPSFHMSVSLDPMRGWHCWRVHEHKGRSPARLIAALLHCTYAQAQQVAGWSGKLPTRDVEAHVKSLLEPRGKAEAERVRLHLPGEFLPFPADADAFEYVAYLKQRGIVAHEIDELTDRFDVYYARRGPYGARIVFTVYEHKELVSWTARTIGINEPRYKARESTAGFPITEYLLWRDDLKGPVLVLCEGPFDALNVRLLGEPEITATCFFGAQPSDAQIARLHGIRHRFERVVLLLDAGTIGTSLRTVSRLAHLDVEVRHLESFKDPGAVSTTAQLQKIIA
jgi:hypothetical protein